MIRYKPAYILILFLILAGTNACDYTRNTTGWEYGHDMSTSPAYESYTENPVFDDGKTMQPPVDGTIPRGDMPYPLEKTDEDRALAAELLENPLELTPANLERGKQEYEIYCIHCHGEKGNGQGSLYVSKKYTYPPANLLSEKMMDRNEADIFHVITVGYGVMGEHGSMIQENDRWRIAMYIKEMLQ